MRKENYRLEAAQLFRDADLTQIEFETTSDLAELHEVIGQPRAVDAIQFGTGMKDEGYNIYALGPTGLNKRGLVQRFFESRAREQITPSDWVYIHNFEQEHKPLVIELPPGQGQALHKDMEQLKTELKTALPAAFESEEYQSRRQAIHEEFRERQSDAFEALQQQANKTGLALIRTPSGIAVAPTHAGEVLSPEEIDKLSEEEQQRIQEKVENLQSDLQRVLQQVPGWQHKLRDRVRELNREMANFAVVGLIDELKENYATYPRVITHLGKVQEDVVENAEQFLSQGPGDDEGPSFIQAMQQQSQEFALQRYTVNVLIDHSESEGAPVIYEDNPTYQNLIGRIEHRAQMGALMTDFTLIKPGALHHANGGYLILDIRKLLLQPYAWEGLKRALMGKRIAIESLGQQLSLISTVSLEPEPIPLDLKVALIGDRMIYYLLWQLDPEFAELFKIAADFDEQMDRNGEHQARYARLIATLVQHNDLQPFDRSAVSRIIEHSSRLAGDTAKLSMRQREIEALLLEANHWAQIAGAEVVTEQHIQQTLDAQIHRVDRIREHMQEAILRETYLIDTEGAVTGQINGLSVLMLGNFAFGRPTRITARTSMGKGQVIDIEREVELGGPIHSKGVMILTGFLSSRYAQDFPLSLAASLVFEQSYSGVEGDSASSAELYALLSAIASVPIQQSLAVTGSVNQKGEIQAIGGVNEKIEGFFDICQARGLTGDQGVLIPKANVKHLMLRRDVVEAVAASQFHVYAVTHVDQGIEILTGLPAGEPDERGAYPEDSINGQVKAHLRALATARQTFSTTIQAQEREGVGS
jgi:lon-related putative ATP-dependent protease